MSYMRAGQSNGAPSYMNGTSSTRLRRFDFDTTPDDSPDERSQSRGAPRYGVRPTPQSDTTRGALRVDRQRANGKSTEDEEPSPSRSRSRPSAQRPVGVGSQTDDILRYIEQQWSFMANDSCVPIKVALQLMDSSSLGLAGQQNQFKQVHQQLQNALKLIVNEHHQGFNSSIGTYHKIQAAIHTSQHRIRLLRAGLVRTKGNLATARPELQTFSASSQTYDQMLQVLTSIETLRGIPDQLEVLISEKRFLGAVTMLQEALAMIRKPELDDIGALSDLKVYLSNQEHSLTDILIEELHSHLYLKSPYCEERWKSHIHRHTANNKGAASAIAIRQEERAMHTFLDTYDGAHDMQEDVVRNPESGTFYYIQLLVESLNRLGKLDTAVDAIEQRLPVELFRLVERTHNEVEQRHPYHRLRNHTLQVHNSFTSIKLQGPDTDQRATLDDLLTTLYAKFEGIAEGHRVLHDVTAAIQKREAKSDATHINRGFRELWKLLQSEIRSLLHDHLASKGDSAGQKARHANELSANFFRPQPRDRTRRLFRLADSDDQSPEIAVERDDLESILKSSVPGLVNNEKTKQAKQTRDNTENALADRSAAGHKLLVEPSVFNMGILLAPSLSFLNRLKEIVPPDSGVVASTLTSFLDDFLVNIFYPQLEETLMELCSRCMDDPEAFQVDPASSQKVSSKPIFDGTARFFELLQAFCLMLDALPHEQSFSLLVVEQMRRYYDKCYQWSRTLLQRPTTQNNQSGQKLRLAADLATNSDINAVVIRLIEANAARQLDQTPSKTDDELSNALSQDECNLLINLVKNRRLEEADLIHERKTLSALSILHASLKWLAARSRSIRYISPRAVDMANMQAQQTRRWTTNANLTSAPSSAYLPLDSQTATQFDAVVTSYTELSNLLLRTLHIDLRLHLLHGIYAALDTTYALGRAYNEPDTAILSLATTLSAYDLAMDTHVLPTQYSFLTARLHVIANDALCHLVGTIPAMDEHGVARMQLNILVLQQALKNIQPDAALERAARFYELAAQGVAAIVESGVKEGFEAGDLKALVRLRWSPAASSTFGSVEDAVAKIG